MGYITDYYGEIKLFDKKAISIIKKMIEEEKEPFNELGNNDIYVEQQTKNNLPHTSFLNIACNWKDYENGMEKICLFVSTLDKKAKGSINCSGEEDTDIWRIIVKGGKVLIEYGQVKYIKGEEFEDIKTKKEVYKITKDKKLMKEIMLESLE